MSFVAIAIGGSTVLGAVATSIGGSKAASAQKSAAATADATTRAQLAQDQEQYEQNRTDLAPYREAGYTALGQLGTGTAASGEFNRAFTMDDYTADPGYQFRLDQGNRAVQASAAAKGGVLSGGTLKALATYNQGQASQEYGNAYSRWQQTTTDRYNRLAGIAGVGQTATNSTISAGQANTAAQTAGTTAIANNALSVGNANASQYVGTANAIGGAANTLGQYFALNKLGATGAGASAYGISGSDGIY